MGEIKPHRRLSVISDIGIFVFVVLLSIGLLQLYFTLTHQEVPYNEISSLISEDKIMSIGEENKKLIKQIKNEYNVTVLFGKDVATYAPMVEGVEQRDEYIVNNNLHIIEQALQKYPKAIFGQISESKHPVYIMLLDSFQNNNLALAARNNLNEYKIYISNTSQFERAFHHEMYHVLEYVMGDKESYLFASWYRYNPIGFKYQSDITKLDRMYVYDKEAISSESFYFVTLYSKVADKEDRAELFAEGMIASKKPSYFKLGEPLRNKIEGIMAEIRENITTEPFYLDKFLT